MTVQVRAAASDTDPRLWLQDVGERLAPADRALLGRALAVALELYPGRTRPDGEPLLTHCREVASVLAGLRMDAETLAAGLLSGVPEAVPGHEDLLRERVAPTVASLVEGVARMAQIQGLRSKVEAGSRPADRAAQLESLRKMLLAMVQDIRVVLVALARQTQRLRYLAGHGDEPARESAARDTLNLFAPLANRLGVWQLKWELEDLALRCSAPDTYKSIARQLDEKRTDREAFIARIIAQLQTELGKAGIARNTSTASTARSRARTSRSPSCSTFAVCACWCTTSRTATRCSAWCTACGRRCRASSTITSPSRNRTATARCIPRW
jgi:GTP pyrophosphokinase